LKQSYVKHFNIRGGGEARKESGPPTRKEKKPQCPTAREKRGRKHHRQKYGKVSSDNEFMR